MQLQQGWSRATNVNFLAAGGSYPPKGSTGSGIYAGLSGSLISVMNLQEAQRRILVAQVPKRSSPNPRAAFTSSSQSELFESQKLTNLKFPLRLLKDPTIRNFTSDLLSVDEQNPLHKKLCDDDFCCEFTIKISSKYLLEKSDYFYRIGVFKGARTYEQHDWNYIRVCGLYTCLNSSADSCGELQLDYNPNNVFLPTFEHISIQATFPKRGNQLIMPITLDKNLLPLAAKTVNWSKSEEE